MSLLARDTTVKSEVVIPSHPLSLDTSVNIITSGPPCDTKYQHSTQVCDGGKYGRIRAKIKYFEQAGSSSLPMLHPTAIYLIWWVLQPQLPRWAHARGFDLNYLSPTLPLFVYCKNQTIYKSLLNKFTYWMN